MKKFAFVFPGQGSQSVGMLDDFKESSVVQETLQEASEALGEDIGKLITEGPVETLNLTVYTQPVMLTAGVALYRLWRAEGGQKPSIVAGHSLGEYAALVAAGVLSFKDAVPLVRFRAQVMQESVPVGQGGMAAILGLSDEDAQKVCEEVAQSGDFIVEAVNYNAPGQIVIAGHRAGVEKACELAKAKGAKRAIALPVSAPFHSSLLKPAAQKLRQYLENITLKAPEIPVINNVDVAMPTEPSLIKEALARQAAAPVRWVESIQAIRQAGVDHLVECGPGKVLAGLAKRIDSTFTIGAITDRAALSDMLDLLK